MLPWALGPDRVVARPVLFVRGVPQVPPAPLVPVAVACCVGLAAAPSLAVPRLEVAGVGMALLVLAAFGAGGRWSVVAGWFLLGLARGGPSPEPPRLDGEALWGVELREDGRDPARRGVAIRLLSAWEPIDRGGRALLWRGDIDASLWLPAWPASAAGRRGEGWLVRGSLREGPTGLHLSAGRSTRLHRSRAAGSAQRMAAAADDALVRIRAGARRAVDRGAPPRLRPLFLALALGDRRSLDPALRARLSRTGTAHLVALSGLHVGTALLAAAGVARWLLRRLAVWIALRWAWGGGADTAALWVGLLASGLYVAVAGAPTSARRALAMAAAAVVAASLGRRPSGWNTLALAALVVAWLDPPATRSLGLQLSLASVGGLLAAASWGEAAAPRVLRVLRSAFVSSLAATLATAPLLAGAFGQVPLASVWVNPVAIPLLGGLTVPPLLLGAGLGAVSPGLGAAVVRLAALPAGLGLDFVTWAGEPARAPMLAWEPGVATIAAVYLSAGLAVALGGRRA